MSETKIVQNAADARALRNPRSDSLEQILRVITGSAREWSSTTSCLYPDSKIPAELRARGFTVSSGEGTPIMDEYGRVAYFISW